MSWVQWYGLVIVDILGFGAVCYLLAQVIDRLPESPQRETPPEPKP